MTCARCGSPEREIWTFRPAPVLKQLDEGNWMWLDQCEQCSSLWCHVPHEPYASYDFWTRWPADRASWRRVHDLDEGATLHAWHDAVLRERWTSLPEEDRQSIESWRERTYRHYNPIDLPDAERTNRRIRQAADLRQILESIR